VTTQIPIRASDLYELSECAHRIALDRQLPREQRAIADEGTAALLARGLALERAVANALNYAQPNTTLTTSLRERQQHVR
jgi:hypothetical protein